jgi:hypothetical protein
MEKAKVLLAIESSQLETAVGCKRLALLEFKDVPGVFVRRACGVRVIRFDKL